VKKHDKSTSAAQSPESLITPVEIDLFGGSELIALDILAKTEKERRTTEKTQRLSSQVQCSV